ncbi:MAG: hypothetical protein B6I24_07945 [Bacteroidetes bacterium 4572_128]|nr:MAG: hypothetical protein B6I24_07945 [Bacteroidetes bacterium 4572_128]
MRIKEINIKGLFGMFDHDISLNLENHITIIYGINGIGKTMFFKILDCFFNSKFSQLVKKPFEELNIHYNDNSFFKLSNEKSKFFIYFFDKKGKKEYTFDLSKYKDNKNDLRIPKDNRFSDMLPTESLKRAVKIKNIKELEKLIRQLKLYFIETQRLIKFNPYYRRNISSHSSMNIRRQQSNFKIDTVKNYSEDLSRIIQEKHNEYSRLSEKLELSLGKRLMNKKIETIITNIQELKKENKKLEKSRNEFKSVGLFEDAIEEKFNIPDDIDTLTHAVLSVNIHDMKEKLKIFDELYAKLNIFLDILNNKRFSYKQISIHPRKGFVFKNANEKPLEVTDLSSGEQHEIVMFYELLFRVPETSLVLIDEPEISLHIAWQKDFLNDMSEIVKIRNFDILIATHSPSIIDGNWNLTVELQKQQ